MVGWHQKRTRIRNQEGFEDGRGPAIGGRADEGHLGGGIDQTAGSQAPALDNCCPVENPSQLRKIHRGKLGAHKNMK